MKNFSDSQKSRLTLQKDKRSIFPHTDTPVGGHIPPTTSQVVGFPTPKKVAVLIDGEFFSRALRIYLHLQERPTAEQTYRNARCLANPAYEEVWRIFYYDSRPYLGHEKHPITGQSINCSRSPQVQARERFLSAIGQMDLIALRCGETRPRGWQLTKEYLQKLSQPGLAAPTADDYELRFEQKGVDMRIGIDIAVLSINRLVDRVIIASNDTDLIPAIKLARRHGIQVVIPKIGAYSPHRNLVEDADFKRPYNPVV